MKKLFLCIGAIVLLGCGSQKIKAYIDDPKTLLADPLTVDLKANMAELERSYAKGEITYADYLEKKKILEDDYTKQVNKRTNWINNRQ